MKARHFVIGSLMLGLGVSGCSTVNPATGQRETSVGQSAGIGALAGALGGALIGGKKGALIGAGAGALVGGGVGLYQRQQELEAALKVAEEIRQQSGMQPTVRQRQFGQASGLESMTLATAYEDTVSGGRLRPKAALAYGKLDRLAASQSGRLVIEVPNRTKAATVDQIRRVAPNAEVRSVTSSQFVAVLSPKVA